MALVQKSTYQAEYGVPAEHGGSIPVYNIHIEKSDIPLIVSTIKEMVVDEGSIIKNRVPVLLSEDHGSILVDINPIDFVSERQQALWLLQHFLTELEEPMPLDKAELVKMSQRILSSSTEVWWRKDIAKALMEEVIPYI